MQISVPGTAHPAPPPGAPAYPYQADADIREFASRFDRRDVVEWLDRIRVELLGDATKVRSLAEQFAGNDTMRLAGEDIAEARQKLNGTWQGRAAEQFATYADRTAGALESNQGTIKALSGALATVAELVVDTYADAILFIGNCAASLAKIGGKFLIAVLTAPIPVVDIFTAKEVLDTVNEAFATFIRDVSGLIGEAVRKVEAFNGQAIAVLSEGTGFREVPELAATSGVTDHRQWKIDPSAFPE